MNADSKVFTYLKSNKILHRALSAPMQKMLKAVQNSTDDLSCFRKLQNPKGAEHIFAVRIERLLLNV